MEETYQYKSKEGDVVRLPNGRLGVIAAVDIICGGHVKKVEVVPEDAGQLKRFFCRMFNVYSFYDVQINDLEKVD